MSANITLPLTFTGTGTIDFGSNTISNFITTTTGDLITHGSRLPIGTLNQALQVLSSAPSWQPLSIPAPISGSSTDLAVGFLSLYATHGQSQLQRLLVSQSISQSLPIGLVNATVVQYNIITDDPLNIYNNSTFLATIPQDGIYIVNVNWYGQSTGFAFPLIKLNGVVSAFGNVATGPGSVMYVGFLSSGTTVGVYHYTDSTASTLVSPANLNFLEIKRLI